VNKPQNNPSLSKAEAEAPKLAALGDLYTRLELDKSADIPVWRQLFSQISQWVESGAIAQGESLPAERELAVALGVSRATVKRCYDELRNLNHLSGKGRGGSVVHSVAQVRPTLGRLKGFTQEMQELGKVPSTEIVEHSIRTDRMMASLFKRPSTAQFLHLVRIRKADGIPMTREVAWYDLTLVPTLAQWDALGSAYNFISNQGIPLVHAEQTVEAVQSTTQETKVFGFIAPGPCLLFKRKTYSDNEQLVEYVEGTFRGDAYLYKLDLTT
jgi:GntR family transcriptional regulator